MEAPYDEFFRANFRLIVKVVMEYGARIDEAEDAAAQAAVEVFARWAEVRDPLAYAMKAALNSFYRSRQREGESHRRAVRALLLSPGPDHDAVLVTGQERSRVVGLLSALPTAQREVMAYTVDGFSPTEMAAMLGKTPEAVRANLRHARKRLSQQINEGDGRPSDA
jgi:RNA polymerase sigma-70 factor (ECF subfamily)